ncbi:DUF1592 domain-containing protein [bacterium]|nr:DUF1592 domain-containing protein [bacterium]
MFTVRLLSKLHLALSAALALLLATSPVSAQSASVKRFFAEYCNDCHSGETPDGGLNLETLTANLAEPAVFAKWERTFDRVVSGEMPPRESDQPTAAVRNGFTQSLKDALTRAHQTTKGTVLRRLNRREYQNTLNDLFGTNLDLVTRLPADGRSHEFDNVGEALGISMVQLRQYLDCAEDVLDAAIVKSIAPPESTVIKASYADTRGVEQFLDKVWLRLDDGAVVFYKAFGYPSGMLREANVRSDGWYRIRVTGYAYQSDKPITFSIGGTTFTRGAEQPTFGYFSMPPGKPTTVDVLAWMPARYMVDVTPYGLTDRDNEIRKNGVRSYKGPGLAVQHVEVEGPITTGFPTHGHKLIFDGLQRNEILPRNPSDRQKSWYVPKFEIATQNPDRDAEQVLVRVASRAFRRPATAADVAPYLDLFNAERQKDATFEEALRTAVTAILCAPEFLYLKENAGPLDDYALAARLSYFLTRSLPDADLLKAAEAGRLASDREVLFAQTERLLKHPHSERFITDFTDAWLNLREIEFTNPDSQLFPEFDPFLQFSMVDETRSFFRELIDRNLSVVNVVRSDFAMLNSRLADHYDIDGVTGPELRPVSLPSDSVRGGFLTQASVLKVSANGTNTSPVVRGIWVMERILGQTPPPPPAGVPGVEPDIRGASTLRELLDKHRDLDTCRACHQLIDPPGFALESFNPIGGWRDRYRSLGEGDRVETEVNGQRVRYRLGPPVDATGSLPDGRPFDGFRDFRNLLAAAPDTLTRSLATKLLTFATGREMGFSDREEITRIVAESAKTNHGIRDLIRLVVSSEIFRSK